MSTTNRTSSFGSDFVLVCFSQSQGWQHWISVPFALLFLATLGFNITLLVTIYSSQSLHQPMYFMIGLLSLVDITLSVTISPKMLSILWFDEHTISSAGCLSQGFFAFFCQTTESFILIFMSLDRYIAICHPLRYPSILTNKLVAKAVSVTLSATVLIGLPIPLMAKLHSCATDSVPHCFCQTLAVADLGCGDTQFIYTYGLVLLSVFIGILTIALIFSYTMIIRAVLKLGFSVSARKAFSTCSSHLIVTGLVFVILAVAATFSRIKKLLPQFAHVVFAVMKYLTLPALCPLVYGIRTRNIRKAMGQLFEKSKQMCLCGSQDGDSHVA